MKKQYIISRGPTFRVWVTTFQDGAKMQEDKIWLDDLDDYTDELERAGYERAYTAKEVQDAKEEYERKLSRQLVRAD